MLIRFDRFDSMRPLATGRGRRQKKLSLLIFRFAQWGFRLYNGMVEMLEMLEMAESREKV